MKSRAYSVAFLIAAIALSSLATLQAAPGHNTLSAKEKKQGWKLLFDGKKIEGWRSYKKNTFPKDGWVVEDGTIHKQEGKCPGDIMTVAAYENFEFAWEWKLPTEKRACLRKPPLGTNTRPQR